MSATNLMYQGIHFDSDEEVFFAMWLEELKQAELIREWKRSTEAIPLTHGIYVPYIKTTKLKTKTRHEEKIFTVLRPSEYTPDFEVDFSAYGIQQFVNYIKPVGSFDKDRLFFSGERLKGFFEVKPAFDQNNMERLFKNNQKFIWHTREIFINMIEPVELFKKTFMPAEAAEYFKYKKKPTSGKNKHKGVGDWKVDFIPKSINEYLCQPQPMKMAA
jgi:hypothetical protein